jgi:dihydrodipicolinate synthase/N-acetylneuraminate lyase
MIKTLECVVQDVRVFAPFISRRGHSVLTGIGGDGNIDGGPTAASFGVEYYQNVQRSNSDAALLIADDYCDLMGRLIRPDWSGVFGTPQAQYKAFMNLMDQPGGYPRLPLLPVDETDKLKSLRDVLASSGLVTWHDH